MDKLEILRHFSTTEIKGVTYVKLEDVEFLFGESTNSEAIEVREAEWPKEFDETDVEDYKEYFIRGTNIRLGYKCFNKETGENEYCGMINESCDNFVFYNGEKELIEHFNYILNNRDLIWQYYE